MDFLVATYTPPTRALLGTIPEKWEVLVLPADDIEQLKARLKIPLGGVCHVIVKDDVTTIQSRIVNEVV